MSARHIILGLIKERPSHTYEVATRFHRRIEPWQINRGQVHRTLLTLEREELVEAIEIDDASTRAERSWQLTAAGEAELERWFTTLCEDVEPLRGEVIAKLAVASADELPLLHSLLDWYERALLRKIEEAAGERRIAVSFAGEDPWRRSVAALVAERAQLHNDAELQWAQRVRATLDAQPTGAARERRSANPDARRAAQG